MAEQLCHQRVSATKQEACRQTWRSEKESDLNGRLNFEQNRCIIIDEILKRLPPPAMIKTFLPFPLHSAVSQKKADEVPLLFDVTYNYQFSLLKWPPFI